MKLSFRGKVVIAMVVGSVSALALVVVTAFALFS